MKLRIATRNLMEPFIFIDATSVSFMATDERAAFEVTPIEGGGLDVRGLGCHMVDGELRDGNLEILPRASNSVEIRGRRWKE